MITINEEQCKGCGLCVSVCKKEALKQSNEVNKNGYRFVLADNEKCIGCGMCYRMCPDCCITIET